MYEELAAEYVGNREYFGDKLNKSESVIKNLYIFQ